eukprot:COSAG05_NODE_38_length_27626_cov_78.614306_13_plen_58_part_00
MWKSELHGEEFLRVCWVVDDHARLVVTVDKNRNYARPLLYLPSYTLRGRGLPVQIAG